VEPLISFLFELLLFLAVCYPISRLVRLILLKYGRAGAWIPQLTAVITSLVTAVYLGIFLGMEDAVDCIKDVIIVNTWLAFLDSEREKGSALVRSMESRPFRYIFGAVAFLLLLLMLFVELDELSWVNDPHRISPFLISSIYCYFTFRKKRPAHQEQEDGQEEISF
jgi:hypothetical protein